MKKQEKKFVLAALVLLAAITGLLALSGCKNDTVPEPTRYTVKFDKGDNSEYTGDLPADITVESGTKLTAEQLEGLAGTADYIFEGWYDGETKAESGTYTVTKDVTLVAKWRDRGVTAAVSFSVDENGRVALSSETKDAVIYYTINGSGPDENSSKYGEPIEISAQTTVRAYAQGTGMKPSEVAEKTYLVVTFNADGGSDVAPQVVVSGTKLTAEQLKGLADTADYIFEGWYDGETKAEGGTYTVTKDVTLEAKWKPRDQVQINFKVSGNTVELSSEPAEATIHYTTDGTEPKERWDEYANPIEISSKTTIKAYAEKLGELKESDVVEKTYLVVTFNTNGGSEVAPQVVESAQPATKPTDPTNGDMVLDGWYTSEDDGTTLADTAYSFDTPVAGDIILYAAWNGRVDGNIVLKNKVMSKTSEEQVSTGTFQMGSTAGYGDEKPVHGVTISKGYFMGRHEVTQQLYFAVMGKNPSNFKTGTENEEPKEGERELPVERVSWYDAVVFCNELSELMGLEPVYSKGGTTDTNQWGDVPTISNDEWNKIECNWEANGYRLPTEAEWEYAARAGDDTTNARTWSGTKTDADLEEYAWYSGNSDSKTHQVGTKKHNSLNLYDMSGNVWEWCWDWYGNYSDESVSDPYGGSSGGGRVLRGGGWHGSADLCTVSRRNYFGPYGRGSYLGFRLVRPSSK